MTVVGTGSLADKTGAMRTGSATIQDQLRPLLMDQYQRAENGLTSARLQIAGAECCLVLAVVNDTDEYAPLEWHGFISVAGHDTRVQICPKTWVVTFWDCVQRRK